MQNKRWFGLGGVALMLALAACGEEEAQEESDNSASNNAQNNAANNHANHGNNAGNNDANNALANNAGNNAIQPGEFAVRFAARFGSQDFACGESYGGLGTTGASLTPRDLRFYVHDVRLVGAGGEEVPLALEQDGAWQTQGVALLDFEDKTGPCSNGTSQTRDTVVGTAPAGTYTAVRFRLGVPFDLNHEDVTAAASPLNLSGMFWSWQGGYKFLRLDNVEPFRIHLGSTQCEGSVGNITGCQHPNRPEIEVALDPATQTVVLDLAELLAGTDVEGNSDGTAPGCMSDSDDPDCGPIFERLGLTEAPQRAFRAE